MNKQSAKMGNGEILMRTMASVVGQEILSFAVDYKLNNGEDWHGVWPTGRSGMGGFISDRNEMLSAPF